MGQKVYPVGPRLGITEEWRSRWFQGKGYDKTLFEDIQLRRYLTKRLKRAALSRIDIERTGDKVTITLYTARPGIVIGKKGTEVDTLRKDLEKIGRSTSTRSSAPSSTPFSSLRASPSSSRQESASAAR
jgi:small subunit ribosomal protein S3